MRKPNQTKCRRDTRPVGLGVAAARSGPQRGQDAGPETLAQALTPPGDPESCSGQTQEKGEWVSGRFTLPRSQRLKGASVCSPTARPVSMGLPTPRAGLCTGPSGPARLGSEPPRTPSWPPGARRPPSGLVPHHQGYRWPSRREPPTLGCWPRSPTPWSQGSRSGGSARGGGVPRGSAPSAAPAAPEAPLSATVWPSAHMHQDPPTAPPEEPQVPGQALGCTDAQAPGRPALGVPAGEGSLDILGAEMQIFRAAGAWLAQAPRAHGGGRRPPTRAFPNAAAPEGWRGGGRRSGAALSAALLLPAGPTDREAVGSRGAGGLGGWGLGGMGRRGGPGTLGAQSGSRGTDSKSA